MALPFGASEKPFYSQPPFNNQPPALFLFCPVKGMGRAKVDGKQGDWVEVSFEDIISGSLGT